MSSLYTQKKLLESLGFGFVEEMAPLPPEEKAQPKAHSLPPRRPAARREPPVRSVAPKRDEPPLSTLPDLEPDARRKALDTIAAEAAACEKCMLHNTRARTAKGHGDPTARLMVICETPSQAQDEGGGPFDGELGGMYANIIKAMELSPDDVYTTTAVACRPPQGRPVRPEEAESCRPFIVRQIEIIKPEVIVFFGLDTAATLLSLLPGELKRTRGEWREYRGATVMPTLALDFIQRNKARKKVVWDDLQKVIKRLGV